MPVLSSCFLCGDAGNQGVHPVHRTSMLFPGPIRKRAPTPRDPACTLLSVRYLLVLPLGLASGKLPSHKRCFTPFISRERLPRHANFHPLLPFSTLLSHVAHGSCPLGCFIFNFHPLLHHMEGKFSEDQNLTSSLATVIPKVMSSTN